MSKTIKVLKCVPEKRAEFINIENDLHSLQKIVGGNIEVINIGQGILIICNEDGKVKHLKPNRPLYDVNGKYMCDVIFGTFIMCTTSGENFSGLTFNDYDKVSDKYFYPYEFHEWGMQAVM